MRRLLFAFILSAAAVVSVRAQTDLLHADPWAHHDSAIASEDRRDVPQFSIAAQTLGTPSEVSPLAAPIEDCSRKIIGFSLSSIQRKCSPRLRVGTAAIG